MSAVAAISFGVTILVALAGYIATHFSNLRLAQHANRVELVSQQLKEFYGPLHVACEAGEAAYIGLLRKLGKVDRVTGLVPTGRELFESPDTLNDADRKEWRIWFRHVFQPLDEVRELLILNSAYLAREAQIPPCLLQLVAYASQSKALVCKWDEDDFSEHVVATDFPADLSRYAADGYNELSKQRQELQEASTWRRLIGARDTVQQ